MRDRLIELLCNIECKGEDWNNGGCALRKNERCIKIDNLDMCMIGCIADVLLANGVIVPPCNLGQTLFVLEDIGIQTLPEIVPLTVYNLAFTVFEEGIKSHIVCITKLRKVRHIKGEDLGKTAFLTREEAEKALAERSAE